MMNMMRILCTDGHSAHLDDFEYCFLLFTGFLHTRMCFLECCRTKHSMCNSVWQEWTTLRGGESDFLRFMSVLCAKQVRQDHREVKCRGTFAQRIRNSTVTFWTISLPKYGTVSKITRNSCFSPSSTLSSFRHT